MRERAVFVTTYGCQMNELDSELVQDQLTAAGYHMVTEPEAAGVVLINTCSVRALAEQKVWSQLGRLEALKDERPELVIGVLGCMAEREGPRIMKRMPHVDIVCGPSLLDRLPALIDNARHNRAPQLALSGHTSRRSATYDAADGVEALDLSRAFSPERSQTQAYVRITRGCNKFCSFCVVPYTRGPEAHRPPATIVAEVQKLVAHGALEVTLLGQTVNHYLYKDGGHTTSFADLLWRVHEEVPELPRLRFVTSYPRDFTDEALDVMAGAARVCPYLHVPAQSGSNRLLRLMNRGYSVEEYQDLITRARRRLPTIRIATDMIVGFPTETEEDHQQSLDLVRTSGFKSAFVFKYSPRPGTVAYRRLEDDVPEEVKRRRNLELLEAQAQVSLAQHRARVGSELQVLVEGMSKLKQRGDVVQLGGRQAERTRLVARSTGDEIVAFDGVAGLVGKLVRARVVDATELTLLAELSEPANTYPQANVCA